VSAVLLPPEIFKNFMSIMTHTVLLWDATVGLLLIIFMFRLIQKFRHETPDSRLIEWERDDSIHYEQDEEED